MYDTCVRWSILLLLKFKKNCQYEKKITNNLDSDIKIAYISDFAAYNEYDSACGGGYFECPYCGSGNEYVSESSDGKIYECSKCSKKILLKS